MKINLVNCSNIKYPSFKFQVLSERDIISIFMYKNYTIKKIFSVFKNCFYFLITYNLA